MDPAPSTAPPVVAVVVTKDPGPWFEEVLASLAAQDYPNLSVLVLDAGSTDDPTPSIAQVLPAAYVRRLGDDQGFGWAANHALALVEGAAFYCLCHDDVALDPAAVRLLVEEAFRSNAGVVAPKVVTWDDPEVLLSVGMAVDKTGVPSPYAEPGDLDQSQYDQVRDAFFAPGSVTLIRADLFATLGGYDPDITYLGDDVDLCWRAHVAGARVVVSPSARVRHRQELPERRPHDDLRRLAARHRLRTTLTCYSAFHLLRVLPQAAVLALVEVVYAALLGRGAQAKAVAAAWPWNLRRLGTVLRRRRALRRLRQTPDREVRQLQVKGFVPVAAVLRGQGSEEERGGITSASRSIARALAPGPRRLSLLAWGAVALVLLVGSRHLLSRGLPSVSGFAPFPGGPGPLLREFLSGWRLSGLGSERPAPTAYGMLGLGGLATFGAMGLLQQLVVLGMLPVGLIGAWRLLAATGSRRARVAALVVYAAVPLPYNAIATGQWGGLVLYGASPWILGALARATELVPWGRRAEPAPTASFPRQALALGLVIALAGTVVPFVVVLVPLVAVGLLAGSLLVGGVGRTARALGLALAASAVAALLHVPWTLDFLLPGRSWAAFGGIPAAGSTPDLAQLLRFETGPLGAAPLGWAFLIVGALPLVVGSEWRRAWAARAWGVALLSWGLAWAAARGWVPVGLPPADVLLAPAAAGLALAAGLGLAAFEIDLPGHRFGWRQAALVVAGVAAVVGVLPVLGASVDGRWDAPRSDFDRSLAFLDDEADQGGFRVLWVGDPAVLPLAGWRLADGLAFATSRDGTPGIDDEWQGSEQPATTLLADALALAAEGDTARFGRLVAPMGVRYVIVPTRAAPELTGMPVHPVPAALSVGLASQLDLEQIPIDGALTLYENLAWAPSRALLPPDTAAVAASDDWTAAAGVDLAGSEPVLLDQPGPARYQGDVPAGEVLVAEASSSRWALRAGGVGAPRAEAFGWANRFTVAEGAEGSLQFRTPPWRYLALLVQIGLWVAAVVLVIRARRREVVR
ncbi:MAG: glycosyltransferase family 2 protein [Acidimicrobiales bacterium]|nr:glycosyltransferase family 2 protein [Acidimicrobiales bacterium]